MGGNSWGSHWKGGQGGLEAARGASDGTCPSNGNPGLHGSAYAHHRENRDPFWRGRGKGWRATLVVKRMMSPFGLMMTVMMLIVSLGSRKKERKMMRPMARLVVVFWREEIHLIPRPREIKSVTELALRTQLEHCCNALVISLLEDGWPGGDARIWLSSNPG